MQLATVMSLLEKKSLGKLSQLLSLDDIAKLRLCMLPLRPRMSEAMHVQERVFIYQRKLLVVNVPVLNPVWKLQTDH
jgi:hypothetical protein